MSNWDCPHFFESADTLTDEALYIYLFIFLYFFYWQPNIQNKVNLFFLSDPFIKGYDEPPLFS